MLTSNDGMNPSEWKLTKLRMLNTGEFDPEDWNKLSDYQKYFCNELKKSYRDLTNNV